MRRSIGLVGLFLLPALAGAQEVPPGRAIPPAVRAILFFSPTCPHCQDLVEQKLPPLLDRYGARLEIVGVNVMTPRGSELYRAAIAHYSIPESRQGVPTLVVGPHVLVGGAEIPVELPRIVEAGLAGDGVNWPDVAAIREGLLALGLIERPQAGDAARAPPAVSAGVPARADTAAARSERGGEPVATAVAAGKTASAPADARSRRAAEGTTASEPLVERTPPEAAAPRAEQPLAPSSLGGRRGDPAADSASPGAVARTDASDGAATPIDRADRIRFEALADPARARSLTPADRFRMDPAGNGLAVAVLVLMVAAMMVVARVMTSARYALPDPPAWAVPALAVPGMLVATYLTWVEVTGIAAVCGPVGHCNAVQQSEYARLWGVVPVGALGAAGYAFVLATWGVGLRAPPHRRRISRVLVWMLAAVATLFSAYLTFLEPFVIGASCAWCLASAVIVTLLLLAATPAVQREFRAGASSGRDR
jgi:uncharacterized membrane protein